MNIVLLYWLVLENSSRLFVYVLVKLNGARNVTGVLRGFDPFMNLVVDEGVEETKTGERRNVGMVVSI